MSTMPGASTRPRASTRVNAAPAASPTAAIRPSFTARFPSRAGAPRPSTMRAFSITRSCTAFSLLDHVVGLEQQRRRDRQAEGPGRLEVEAQLELGRLLDGQLGGLGPLEDPVDGEGGAPVELALLGPVAHEAPGHDEAADSEHRG